MSVAVVEQETVICISRDSEECTVYTSDSTMMTKLINWLIQTTIMPHCGN